jgi:glycosyltransferase involved in cell wall biosynthesis
MVDKPLPAVTIGIPFHNAERFLFDAIRSVFAQTHEDWELILIDDGSTDRSLEIARSIDDPRVLVFSDGENKKLAARLNQICFMAKHNFVARMDADDMMASDRIEKQLKFLQDQPDFDLVTTGVCSITDDSVPYGIRLPSSVGIPTPYAVLSGAHGITHAAIVGRKDWFIRNPYDPTDYRAQDYKLWIRARQKDDLLIGFIKEPLYLYREVGSMTPEKMLLAQRLGRKVIKENGVRMVGAARTAYLIGRSWLKSSIIQAFAAVGATDHIVRARSPLFDAIQFASIERDIATILSTPANTRRASECAG